jgi:hypothetical protein
MPRIRTIKPEFPQSESMGRVSRDARLLFVQVWTVADDEGKTRGHSRALASLLFPFDDDAPHLIDGWLGELEREGCVQRYTVDGTSYLRVSNWSKHQRIDRPSRSFFPDPTGDSPSPRESLANPREPSTLDLDQGRDQGPKDQGPTEPQAAGGVAKKRSKQPAFDATTAELPAVLATAVFKAAWADWCQHRRELGKPLTATATRQQLTKLAALGPQRAVAAITHSIAQGWTGVYEPDAPRTTNGKSRTSGNLDQLNSFLEQNGEHNHGSPIIDSQSSNGDFRRLESANGRRPA